MRRYLPFIIVAFVAVLAVTAGVVLYQKKRPPVLVSSQSASGKAPGQSLHVLGSPDAPVTLEEFGDYQCPPCGKLAEPLTELEKQFKTTMRLIFYNFPLPNHQHARAAAYAAEAAGLQGKFWEMHDLIYRQQSTWSKAPDVQPLFESYAGMLGLNLERFKKDMQSEGVKARVDADQKRGSSIGVQNTPTLFLNNLAVAASDLAPDRLRGVVADAVKAAMSKSSGSPTPRR